MADATNQGVPSAGGQLSGDVARQMAIKRLKKLSESSGMQKPNPAQASPTPPLPKG